MELVYKELTEGIIGAAIEVHKSLGPGYLESVYEEAFAVELSYQGIPFEKQKHLKYDIVDNLWEHIEWISLFIIRLWSRLKALITLMQLTLPR